MTAATFGVDGALAIRHCAGDEDGQCGTMTEVCDPPPLPKARRKMTPAGHETRGKVGRETEGERDRHARGQLDSQHHRRGLIERLLDHASDLDASDAALVCSVYDSGLSATQLARALRQQPRAVRGRLHRLIMRISSPAFQFVAREKDRWPPRRRQVAECIVLRARSQRQTARDLGITVHEVRKHLAHVTALMDG